MGDCLSLEELQLINSAFNTADGCLTLLESANRSAVLDSLVIIELATRLADCNSLNGEYEILADEQDETINNFSSKVEEQAEENKSLRRKNRWLGFSSIITGTTAAVAVLILVLQ